MIYVDPSVIVSALTREPATIAAQRWLFAQTGGDLVLSDWTVTEFSAALSVKVRVGAVDLPQRATALAEFKRVTARYFRRLTMTRADYLLAARLCDRANSGLRASDALHLAIAERSGAEMCTLDRRLAAAAEAVGVRVIRPA